MTLQLHCSGGFRKRLFVVLARVVTLRHPCSGERDVTLRRSSTPLLLGEHFINIGMITSFVLVLQYDRTCPRLRHGTRKLVEK
jgi:hypothetical protein